jgi:hypothetical protein
MGIDVYFGGHHVTLFVWEFLAYVGGAVILIAVLIAGCRRLISHSN